MSKNGDPRVRVLLVAMVRQLMCWQINYHGLKKWKGVMGDPGRSSAARKKAILAIACQLPVDLWRLFTGQTMADKRGLSSLPPSSDFHR